MSNISIAVEALENMEIPFTELFSLLKRYEKSSDGLTTLAYNSDELKIMYLHIDNAIDALLQGLHVIGQLLGMTPLHGRILDELNHVGFFISAIANLTEALNSLRSDADYVLRERGVMNY